MTNGVVFMIQGSKHWNQLVVAVYSLSKHYDGRVCLIAGDDEGEEVSNNIQAEDHNLGLDISVLRWDAPTRGQTGKSGQCYANKCEMGRLTPFDQSIFLDADVLVVDSLDDLWPKVREVKLTAFADWVTTGKMMGSRIARWKDVCPDEYKMMSEKPYPAINTGVIGFCRYSTFMPDWKATTNRNVCFICDEIAAQLIFVRHNVIVMDDRWNFSPKYSKQNDKSCLPISNFPKIIHYHGKQHARPDKSDGYKTWIPVYKECLDQNIAGIQDWTPGRDRHLRKYLEAESVLD